MVIVIVNGKREKVGTGTTLGGYLAAKGIDPAVTVVEVNEAIVKKESFGTTLLKENDSVEILRFVGGG
jgi:sulfur carrier protein